MEGILREDTTEQLGAPVQGLLNAQQTADYLSVSTSYIRKAVASNRIPFVRLGSRTLFRRADLDDWIAHHRVPTATETRSTAARIASSLRLESNYPRGATR